MYFEANTGQSDPSVRFLARGIGYAFFLTGDEAVAVLHSGGRDTTAPHVGSMAKTEDSSADSQTRARPPAVVRMRLQGANGKPAVQGVDLLPGRSNYFVGKDPAKWRAGVAQYAKVRMTDVYPGIDVLYYGNQRQLEYDFVVKPGADPSRIRLQFEGAERITLNEEGDLVLGLHDGELVQRAPIVYQERNGRREAVHASYRSLSGGGFGIALGKYDDERTLVIDPVLVYSTYLGGSGVDQISSVATDAAADTFITGATTSPDFPTSVGAFQSTKAGAAPTLAPPDPGTSDVFIAKLNPAGTALLYATYLGGTNDDAGNGVTVDAVGNAYVVGTSYSTDFPTTAGAAQQVFGGSANDAFVTKLNATGSTLLYSTYLGGSGYDNGISVAIDSLGNAYIGGAATPNFPVTGGAFQTAPGGFGSFDAFVAKLDATGATILYATLLGSIGTDAVNGIAVDATGFAYVTGFTSSPAFSNFPTTLGAFKTVNTGSSDDAFVAKVSQNGSALVYSTLLGGTGSDTAFGIAIDGTGNAYVTGFARSLDFPTTAGVVQPANASVSAEYDAFVAKMNPAGTALVYSTYLGGTGSDTAYAIAIDGGGDAYVIGSTSSTNFPVANALQASNAGLSDAFIAKLDPTATQLLYSTYLGTSRSEYGAAIAVDSAGDAHIGGGTESGSFPTTPGSYRPTYVETPPTLYPTAPPEGFVALLSTNIADLSITKTDGVTTAVPGGSVTYTITASNAGPSGVTGATVTDPFPAGMTCNWTCGGAGGGTCAPAGAGNISDTVDLPNGGSVTYAAVCSVSALAAGTLANTATMTAPIGVSDPNLANNSATDSDVIVTTVDLVLTKIASASQIVQRDALTYTLHLINNGPAPATSVIVTDPLPAGMTATSVTTTVGTCSGTTLITCNVGTLASGAAVDIVITVSSAGATVGPTTNTATATSSQTDTAPANNAASAAVTISLLGSIPTATTTGLLLMLALLGAAGFIALEQS
ncbi:MAG: SBBP repeat-containing protein [Acidobacteriota bacterium]